MKWLSLAIAIALIGAPTMTGAQEQRDGGTAAAAPHGAGAAMPCPMMGQPSGGQMSGGMMGMMAGPGFDADPKGQARWMQMRGEMMKAMGEIMMRYGREQDPGK